MLTHFELHRLVKRGNLERVRELLAGPAGKDIDVNAYDNRGYTPLMHAVKSPKAGVELVRLLLEHGASIHLECFKLGGPSSMAALCLSGGDPRKLAVLLEHGSDIHYQQRGGYNALIDAVHGRHVLLDPYLIDLLKLLIARGVELNGVTSYNESGLRVLSRIGRFDAVRLLLDSGADETQLEWTPLIRAVVYGSPANVARAVKKGADLEARDRSSRTPWLIAVQTGDVAKARLLMECGASTSAVGHCGRSSLFYAIENHHAPMLRWLLELGNPVDQTNEFGETPLMAAVGAGNAEAIDILLVAGADVDAKDNEQTALSLAETREIALRLLDAGADTSRLSFECRRALLGLDPEADESLLDVSPDDYRKGRARRFGARNPEKMVEPFWEGMIRAGISAYAAEQFYVGQVDATRSPIWSAERFGQSITFLPDGRIVQIGGEHEDSYMSDFCIYNDVFLHNPDGSIQIFGYPELVFPPTDFHTATLLGECIFIIGALGYSGTRQYGTTPVYRLHTKTFQMEQVTCRGDAPGWIYKHRALRANAHEIRIHDGEIVTGGKKEMHAQNARSFILDTQRLVWRLAGE
jgi:ankyrin repeat protein